MGPKVGHSGRFCGSLPGWAPRMEIQILGDMNLFPSFLCLKRDGISKFLLFEKAIREKKDQSM